MRKLLHKEEEKDSVREWMNQLQRVSHPTRRWLFLVRTAWCVMALLVIGLVVVSILMAGSPSQGWHQEHRIRQDTVCDECPILIQSIGQEPEQVDGVPSFGSYLYHTILSIVFVLSYLVVAGVLIWRKPDDRMALFAAFFLVFLGVTFAGSFSTLPDDWNTLVMHVTYLGGTCLFLFLCLFPLGRFRPWWSCCIAVVAVGYYGCYALFVGTSLNPFERSLVLDGAVKSVIVVSIVFLQIYRYKRVLNAAQRRQAKWVVFGECSAILLYLVDQLLNQWNALSSLLPFPHEIIIAPLLFIALLLIPLSLGIAILRSQLWNIDLIIHRTLVYGLLSACVVGLYILLVGGVGTLLQQQGNVLISLLATGLIAVLFHPLRERLQRGVNRLVYGARHDPYQVLSQLSQRLETTLAPQTTLSTIVETVAQTFKLPYVAISLKPGMSSVPDVVHGQAEQKESLLRIPLSYQGEGLGELTLSNKLSEEGFSRTDRRLLEDLARHAGVAVHAARLSADIQRSREQLVMAREEERRRLRRDLHDGLGPQLASQMLLLTTVRKVLRKNPEAAERMLSEAMLHMQEAINDIRRLVYGLRPPALDDLGLLAALQEDMRCYDTSEIVFTLVAPEPLPPLPAAVEVACYRIAQEALTNVIRHAHARHCTLHLSIGEALELEVIDDGQGLPIGHKKGVGLTSMRERARELGGTCSIGPSREGGIRMYACLPLPRRGR